jgi:hypothetical protein
MATITPPINILELKKNLKIGSDRYNSAEGKTIVPANDVKSIYPITIKGKNLLIPVALGRLLGI